MDDIRIIDAEQGAIPTLQAGGLTLRPFRPEDAAALYRIYQTEGVLRYFPPMPPATPERLQRFVAGQQAHWDRHGYGNWAVVPDVPAGQPELAGWAGLQFLPELDETEVGFLLDRPFWGKGYATAAALASLWYGFERLRLDHVIALVHPDNLPSRRVVAKCGMTYVETIALWGTRLMRHVRSAGDRES